MSTPCQPLKEQGTREGYFGERDRLGFPTWSKGRAHAEILGERPNGQGASTWGARALRLAGSSDLGAGHVSSPRRYAE